MQADRWIPAEELQLMRQVLRDAALNWLFACAVSGVVLVFCLRKSEVTPDAGHWYVLGCAISTLCSLRVAAKPVNFGLVDPTVNGRALPFEASIMWLLREHRSRLLLLVVGALVAALGFMYNTSNLFAEPARATATPSDPLTSAGLGLGLGVGVCTGALFATDWLYVRYKIRQQ